MIKAILAINSNRTIGHQGTIPWHCSVDLAHFRRMTVKQTVIMGRKTWDSLPDSIRPLPNRTNIVITSNIPVAKASVRNDTTVLATADINQAISWAGSSAWVIGGASLFQTMLPCIQEVYLTVLHKNDFDGDTKLPPFEHDFVIHGIEVLDRQQGVSVYRYVRK